MAVATKVITQIATKAIALLLWGSSAFLAVAAPASPAVAGTAEQLARADDLQYGHQFAAALQVLDRLQQQPQLTASERQQAILMQARIHLAQGDLNLAQQSCSGLLGLSQWAVSATCLLEVASRRAFVANDTQRLQQSYAELQRFVVGADARRATAQDPAIAHWQRQILAEQAALLGDHQASNDWLQHRSFADHAPVDQIRLLDNWLALAQPQHVLERFTQCPEVGQLPGDSLLVRIARAEQLLARHDCWQRVTAERMQIRVARNDPLHAYDIAYYFNYVEPNAEQAMRFARANYAVAQEPADARLLAAAQALANQENSNGD